MPQDTVEKMPPVSETTNTPTVDSNTTAIPVFNPGSNTGIIGGQGKANNEAMPILVLEPQFTQKQLRDGENGYVRACFDVTPEGKATNIEIVESEPGKRFVKNARNSIYKWKFKPAMQDGQAITQHGLCYTMEFDINN
jgi:periplasmic protein TonB